MSARTARALQALQIRPSSDADIPTIAAIYAHHVEHGFGSFEEQAPSVDEVARRRADIIARRLPYLVAEVDGQVLGYTYVSAYRPRPAYRYAVENSVYVAHDAARRGIGRVLLARLIDHCTAAGFRQMIAVIGNSQNHGSIGLHASMGFRRAGELTAVGYKRGRWVDGVLMQRALGEGAETPPVGMGLLGT